MTLQQIKCFLSAAETGSISEAAKRLYMAQSSVSSAIRELEKYCGVQLLERNAKGVILTGAGEELLSELLVIDKKMDFIKNKYSTRKGGAVLLILLIRRNIIFLVWMVFFPSHSM